MADTMITAELHMRYELLQYHSEFNPTIKTIGADSKLKANIPKSNEIETTREDDSKERSSS